MIAWTNELRDERNTYHIVDCCMCGGPIFDREFFVVLFVDQHYIAVGFRGDGKFRCFGNNNGG